jgi:hypothetical protein
MFKVIPPAVSGTAQAGDVRSSKTFSSQLAGVGRAGGLVTQAGGQTITPGTADQALDAGIYDSPNTVKGDANLVAGNIANGATIFGVVGSSPAAAGAATPAQVLTGITFSNANGLQTGTMPKYSGVQYTPTASGLLIPAGYHDGTTETKPEPNLVAANILSGVSIFGVAGSVVAGKPYASGTINSAISTITFLSETGGAVNNRYPITVTGLSFTPSTVVLIRPGAATTNYDIVIAQSAIAMDSGSANTKIAEVVAVGNGLLYELDGTDAYFNSSGFRLPVSLSNASYNWYAFG